MDALRNSSPTFEGRSVKVVLCALAHSSALLSCNEMRRPTPTPAFISFRVELWCTHPPSHPQAREAPREDGSDPGGRSKCVFNDALAVSSIQVRILVVIVGVDDLRGWSLLPRVLEVRLVLQGCALAWSFGRYGKCCLFAIKCLQIVSRWTCFIRVFRDGNFAFQSIV